MQHLSAWMHVYVLILRKNIFVRFDRKTSAKMDEFEKCFWKNKHYTCIQALKCRMQALFLFQIQNLKSDCQDFDF